MRIYQAKELDFIAMDLVLPQNTLVELFNLNITKSYIKESIPNILEVVKS